MNIKLKKRREKYLKDKEEFLEAIKDVLRNKKVQKMKKFNHHSNTSCFKHSMHVAYYNYKICKFLGLDAVTAAKGGMLHDLFLYDWHTHTKETGHMWHGFTHPRRAFNNARTEFELSDKEKDMIIKHMWPLTIALPKHKETSVIIFTDKFCSLCEVIDKYFNRRVKVA